MSERRNLRPDEWSSIEAELAAEMTAELAPLAKRLAARLLERMRAEACGQHVYIPAPRRYDEEAVLADFTGRNHREVCMQHGISRATLYRILNRYQRS